jgi:hypothetical protein
MKPKVQELLLTKLLMISFQEKIVNDDEVQYPGDDYTKNLTEPIVVTRASGVCKTWYTRVQARRTAVLLEAVDYYVNPCMLDSVLHLADIDMYGMYGIYPGGMQQTYVPPETRKRMAVRLGSREMYAVEAVLRTIKPTADGGHFELVVQPCMHSFTDAPPKTYTGKNIALNRVCWVHEDIREQVEQDEFDNWHNAAYERLSMLLDHWKNVFTCRLYENILNSD